MFFKSVDNTQAKTPTPKIQRELRTQFQRVVYAVFDDITKSGPSVSHAAHFADVLVALIAKKPDDLHELVYNKAIIDFVRSAEVASAGEAKGKSNPYVDLMYLLQVAAVTDSTSILNVDLKEVSAFGAAA